MHRRFRFLGLPSYGRNGRIESGDASPHSKGVTLVAAILCLLVVMLFSSAVVSALVTRRRVERLDEDQLQCLLLVESAVGRAKARCAVDPNFSGESWRVSLADRNVTRSGVAEIRIEPIADEPQRRRVRIEARWPDDPVVRVQRIKELIITLPESGTTS